MKKVAIICFYAGVVERGAENLAYYLYKMLSYQTKVYSKVSTSWTSAIPCKEYKNWKKFIKISKRTGFYRLLYQLEKVNPYFDVFSEDFFATISFAKNLLIELRKNKPDFIININGSTVGYFLARYRENNYVPFVSVGGAGKNISEIKNAQVGPNVYIAQTPSMYKFIKQKVPKVNVELITIGADLKIYDDAKSLNDEELKQLSKNAECPIFQRPIILSTSALQKNKRLDYLIRAVAKLPQGSLIFTSDGVDREYLLYSGKKFLGNRFIYLGVVDKNILPRIYKTCDVFCLPSINEPFGNVFVEAMAANKPVVADDDEDRRWIIGDAGVLSDVRSVEKIADALWKAYNTDWGNGPRKQVEKFSWDKIVNQYHDLIQKLVKEKKQCQ